MIMKNCWMASIDFKKDAYYSVGIHKDSQKYLKFHYQGELYKFTAYPNGLSFCPRTFTKLLKPPLSFLRKSRGHILCAYIDDLLLIGSTYKRCVDTIMETIKMFDSLGFVIHPEKSVFIPTQSITFLGFNINSGNMKITLTSPKIDRLTNCITRILATPTPTIRKIAQIIGYIVSSFPAVQYGKCHYRAVERDKINALKTARGNFDSKMCLSSSAIEDLQWWLINLPQCFNVIGHLATDLTIYTDASLSGWGAAMGEAATGGHWTVNERKYHINYLELLAAYFGLTSFSKQVLGKQGYTENNTRQGAGNSSSTRLAIPIVVPHAAGDTQGSNTNSTGTRPSGDASTTGLDSSSTQETTTAHMSCIRRSLLSKGFTSGTIEIILASWRAGTKVQYQTMANRWFEFCERKNCDIISPHVTLPLEFLSDMFNSGLSYSSINTARSMLSSLFAVGQEYASFGQLPIVKRFMKGIFELRPSLLRYSWNVNVALDYIRGQPSIQESSLKEISQRLAFLLCLLSGQRCQTILNLSIANMEKSDHKIVFYVTEKLKHTRVGSHQKPLEFNAFPSDKKLCIVFLLTEYLSRTSVFRQDKAQLLLSYISPHKPISKDTVSHWVKKFMCNAGIQGCHQLFGVPVGKFFTSHLLNKNVDLNNIMKSAGWAKEETFQKYYNRIAPPTFNYGTAVLESCSSEK
ncbi:uncharacterized protein [Antedon mediterranea]|uniref:uncharacterized protein n=1 Tax=Antedon mediterranea TaxID=105859 RepID=UPI003AF9060E